MPRRKKKKRIKSDRIFDEINIPRRDFYINNVLEFSLFYDESISDKDSIIARFLESNDWKWFKNLYNVKFKEGNVSDDLKRVDIITSPDHRKR